MEVTVFKRKKKTTSFCSFREQLLPINFWRSRNGLCGNYSILHIIREQNSILVLLNSGAPRAKKNLPIPENLVITWPTDRPTDRPSVRTTGIPMFTLTLSSYFGSPGERWLQINVVINWQLSKQGIPWPLSPDRIGAQVSTHSNDRRLTILISNWPQTQNSASFFFKYRRGRPFLTMVTCWSRSTSNFYALIG